LEKFDQSVIDKLSSGETVDVNNEFKGKIIDKKKKKAQY
jgi:hypothetical protein